MRRILLLPIFIVALCSCSSIRNGVSNKQARKNNRRIQEQSTGGYTSVTSLQYIDRYKTIAIKEMNLYGIPASITLAQGLFESGSGNADLARFANNHFGIKCTSDWKGKIYYKDDDHANDCFRVYDKAEYSFRDHSLFLKRKNYAGLFELDKSDYRGWAYGLKKAGYATNPNYPSILIGIIEKYNLKQYDNLPADGEVQATKKTDTVVTPKVQTSIENTQKDTLQSTTLSKLYTVKQGDTLYNISKRFGLTVDALKALNNLPDNNIKIGQTLVVNK